MLGRYLKKKPGETEEKLRKPLLRESVDVGLHSETELGYLPCQSPRQIAILRDLSAY